MYMHIPGIEVIELGEVGMYVLYVLLYSFIGDSEKVNVRLSVIKAEILGGRGGGALILCCIYE